MARFRFAAILPLLVLAAQSPYSDLRIERAAGGYRYADGPVWHPELGGLLFSDPPNNRIYLHIPGKATGLYRDKTEGGAGLALDEKSRVLVCSGSRRAVLRLGRAASDPSDAVAETFEGKKLNAPNDLAVSRSGVVFFTDPAFGRQSDTRDLPWFGLYRWTPKGELAPIWRGETRLNGVALSANQRILYATDADSRSVRAWDLDRSGAASNPRVLIDKITGVPNGLKVEEKTGNLFVAAKGVDIYTPQGAKIRTVEIPETPSNLAFGDQDGRTLFVTAHTSLYRIRLP